MAGSESGTWRMEQLELLVDPGAPPIEGALEVRDGRICALGPDLPPPAPGVERLDRRGMVALPGFVQGHVHLCQSLMRGLAEERPLDRWLRECIWPLEAAHDPASLRASARLGLAEALLHGTTSLLDMGAVRDPDVIAECVAEFGLRAILGPALMDEGDGVPPPLCRPRAEALAAAVDFNRRWAGAADGRIGVAFAPRFALSVSAGLWRELAREAQLQGWPIHTHVSETRWENQQAEALHGARPVPLLAQWGVLAARTMLVHGVWLDDRDRALLAGAPAAVIHCPGSNAKLGSGIADLPALRAAGIPIGIGSDGAACNDQLSMLAELRLTAQLQSLRHGPGRWSAAETVACATSGGARALGLERSVGRLAVGQRADVILFERAATDWEADLPWEHGLVYAAGGLRPQEVYIDGIARVHAGRLLVADEQEVRRTAREQRRRLIARATGSD